MKTKPMIFFTMIGLLLIGIPFHFLNAQEDVKATLFKEANTALQQAQEAQADVLAPKNFNKGMEYYRDAESDLKKGRNLEDIRTRLRAAASYFNQATKATRLAQVTFQTALQARSDATSAEAPAFASTSWKKAEEKFADAAEELENGDVNAAKKKSGEAENLYRTSELEAIKAHYLNETWGLLEQADKMDVKDRAPKTLQLAKDLAKKAEKELNENRYDTDVARNLARQARYEAKHAIYLSSTIKKMKDDDWSFEDAILAGEQPLEKIAATMDLVAEFDTGLEKTTDVIVAQTETYQDSLASLNQTVADMQQQNENLHARITEMEEQLGGVQQEKTALAQRMEAQAKIREQFATIAKLFTREQAQTLRDGNDVIIRLVGLNFAVGKSEIEPRYFALLTKVQQAINTFPNSKITVEGHTDSYGGDQMNLKLSQERAEAVRQYLMANMGLSEMKISAVGFGESKPIANNETAEGRAKNRRIDLVIHPQLEGTY